MIGRLVARIKKIAGKKLKGLPWYAKMRALVNIPSAVFAIIVLAVTGVALGITLGVTGLVNSSLNGTLSIPAEVKNALNNLASIGGATITIGAALIILALIFSIVTWIRNQGQF